MLYFFTSLLNAIMTVMLLTSIYTIVRYAPRDLFPKGWTKKPEDYPN